LILMYFDKSFGKTLYLKYEYGNTNNNSNGSLFSFAISSSFNDFFITLSIKQRSKGGFTS